MQTILVPLDGSALAERVLPYARGLAHKLDAKICLIQAFSYLDYDDAVADGILSAYGIGDSPKALQERRQQHWDRLRQHAEGYLAAQARLLQQAGLEVETEVHVGPPAEIIVEIAHRQQASAIAMATHGYGGLKRWTLGSITDKVVHMATRPVFVVRGDTPPPVAPILKRILVPLDGSAVARQALPLATELASRAGAELTLLQAIAPPFESMTGFHPIERSNSARYGEVMELLHWRAQLELETLAKQLRQEQLAVKVSVLNGAAAEVIVDKATGCNIDLIVMATHGYSGLKRWALGSVADKVLHTATTPLALVRAQPAAEQLVAEASEDAQSLVHDHR